MLYLTDIQVPSVFYEASYLSKADMCQAYSLSKLFKFLPQSDKYNINTYSTEADMGKK